MKTFAGCQEKLVPYDYSATIEASNALFIRLTSWEIVLLIFNFCYGAVSREPL